MGTSMVRRVCPQIFREGRKPFITKVCEGAVHDAQSETKRSGLEE
jgi:hypothetical protein